MLNVPSYQGNANQNTIKYAIMKLKCWEQEIWKNVEHRRAPNMNSRKSSDRVPGGASDVLDQCAQMLVTRDVNDCFCLKGRFGEYCFVAQEVL